MKSSLAYGALSAVTATVLATGFGAPVRAQDEKPYTVEDGKVDKGTYNGYRRFHGTCHACHGQDANGSSFAPSLVDAMKELSYDDFKATVTNGRIIENADGSTNAMPAFAENVDIMKYLDDLYAYVKARSDGVLAPGRPAKIPN